jgi:hypothetical protein
MQGKAHTVGFSVIIWSYFQTLGKELVSFDNSGHFHFFEGKTRAYWRNGRSALARDFEGEQQVCRAQARSASRTSGSTPLAGDAAAHVGGKSIRITWPRWDEAVRELGIQIIPAYSPQERGRSTLNFATWQERLRQLSRLNLQI